MEKLKIIQEAFEKAKELYWEKDKAIQVSIELWKHSDGTEEIAVKLWVDQGLGKSAAHIFSSESFQELLDFLGVDNKIYSSKDEGVCLICGQPRTMCRG